MISVGPNPAAGSEPAGRVIYVLRLTATDRTTNRTAVEQVGFYVE